MRTYAINWPRWNTLLITSAGALFSSLLLWFLAGWDGTFEPVLLLVFFVLGISLFAFSRGLYEFIHPTPILRADEHGLSIFFLFSRSATTGEKRKEPQCIPYRLVRSIEVGKRPHDKAPALVIECDREFPLDIRIQAERPVSRRESTFFIDAGYIASSLDAAVQRLQALRTRYK